MIRGSVKPHFPFSNAGKEEWIFDEKIEKRGRETGQKKAGKIFLRVFVTLKKKGRLLLVQREGQWEKAKCHYLYGKYIRNKREGGSNKKKGRREENGRGGGDEQEEKEAFFWRKSNEKRRFRQQQKNFK